jgi:RNA polymerase sigma factor (sigma-70 family)
MPGDQPRASFESIVAPFLADAFALARWLSKDRADAEDILQDACLRAYRAIDSYSGGNARAWVLTIVRHTAYSWLNKTRSSPLVSIDDLNFDERISVEVGGHQNASNETTPETQLIAKADAAQLEKAIAALPLEFRETLVLRDVQGLEYREIAQVTGVPLGTVMSRLARARRRLMHEIKAAS